MGGGGPPGIRVHALRVQSRKPSAEDAWVVVTADTNATWENALVDTSERKIKIPWLQRQPQGRRSGPQPDIQQTRNMLDAI